MNSNSLSDRNCLSIYLLLFSCITINRRSSDLFPIGPPRATLLPLFTHGVYEFIDSISHFPYNTKKDELRIISDFWQTLGL